MTSYQALINKIEAFYNAHLQVKKVGSDFAEQMPNFATKDEKYARLMNDLKTDANKTAEEKAKFNEMYRVQQQQELDKLATDKTKNGGFEQMLHPCDPSGSAGDVINCRCTLGYEAVRGTDGKPKRLQDNPPMGDMGLVWNLINNVALMQISNLIRDLLVNTLPQPKQIQAIPIFTSVLRLPLSPLCLPKNVLIC